MEKEWGNNWTDKQKELDVRFLGRGLHLRRVMRDRYYIVYNRCPDTEGVGHTNVVLETDCTEALEAYLESVESEGESLWRKALWRDQKGRNVLIHTMSDRWLKRIIKKIGKVPETFAIQREIKRRKK